jgi:peroxiredoxin
MSRQLKVLIAALLLLPFAFSLAQQTGDGPASAGPPMADQDRPAPGQFPAQAPPGALPIGTPAPDGIGATVGPSPGAGEMKQGPWLEGSVGTPLTAGARMPANSVVRTVDGAEFDLNAAVASRPTVLIFYRGGWCPYCNAHLRELQESAPALEEMGYRILAISTDAPAALQATMDRHELSYQLLSDASVEVADRFGLKYKVSDQYLGHVKNDHGTDLVAQNGGHLITPAAFVMDTDGVIRFAYVNMNFSVRITQESLLKAAREALAEAP